MRLLLDTHVLLWVVEDKLNAKIKHSIAQADKIYTSLVSLWEIEIKRALGKLKTSRDLYATLEQTSIIILPLSLSHIQRLAALPRHHNDPFDRMLIAQAQSEGLTLLTLDKEMALYSGVVKME